jgi:uncharacterized DUF497 family protein
MADFEWDPRKASQNHRKHGIEFTTATLIWEGLVLERIDSRRDYGEIRFQAFGVAEDRVLTVVYTRRANARRLISARRANSRETCLYKAEISRRKTASTD